MNVGTPSCTVNLFDFNNALAACEFAVGTVIRVSFGSMEMANSKIVDP